MKKPASMKDAKDIAGTSAGVPAQPAAIQQYNRHLQQYVSGFVLSVVLTLAAYLYTTGHGVGGWGLSLALSAMAVAQFAVQLIFFLHMRDESEPRWKLLVFNLALLLLAILVIGTLWIMANLNQHMGTGQQSKDYNDFIIKDEGIGQGR